MSFWEHASKAGYRPDLWQESMRVLDDALGWIELHIEQGRCCRTPGTALEL